MAKINIDITKTISTKGERAGAKPYGNTATMWVDRGLGLMCVRAPYSPDFVKEFKDKVPEADRDFAFEEKVWKFSCHHLDLVITIVGKYFKLEMLPEIQVQTKSSSKVEALLTHVSKDTLNKVWKLVAFELHPDRGGDTEKFQEAKEAYEKLKEEK